MRGGVTKVRLVACGGRLDRFFCVGHAERLLAMGPRASGGWALPDDGPYEYTERNGIRLKKDKGDTGKAVEETGDSQSRKP